MSLDIYKFLKTSPTVEDVYDRIRSIQDEISTAKQYCNARKSLVSRLPAEVLSIIFVYIALSRELKPPGHYGGKIERTWLSVSQVCRFWRDVALNTPRMWGYIYAHASPRFTQLCIERSKSAPIYLRSRDSNPRKSSIEAIFQCASRLKEIELGHYAPELFSSVVNLDTPIIERISLFGSKHRKFRYAPPLAPGSEPPLRHLALHHVIFDLEVPCFSNLRTLSIRSVYTPDEEQISSLELLVALGNMPRLETLEVVNVIKASKIPINTQTLLPCLTSIRIKAFDGYGLSIIPHISCQGIQSLEASAERPLSPEALSPIASTFYAMIPNLPGVVWKTRCILNSSSEFCNATMSIWPDPNVPTKDPPFYLSIMGPPNFKGLEELLSSLPPLRTPPVVTYERPRDRPDYGVFDSESLQRLFQSPSLATVEQVHVHHIEDLLAILSPVSQNSDDLTKPNSSGFCFPSLKHIIFIESEPRPSFDGPKKSKLKKEVISQLKQCLSVRKAAKAGIQSLKIRLMLSILNPRDEKALRKLVDVLDFP